MSHRLICVLVLGVLAACTAAPPPEIDVPVDNFGLAVRSNMAAQIIAKEGEVRTLGPAPGVRRSLAIGRYQTDRVEQPAEVFTTGE